MQTKEESQTGFPLCLYRIIKERFLLMVRGIKAKVNPVDPNFHLPLGKPRNHGGGAKTVALVLRTMSALQELAYLKGIRYGIFKALNPKHFVEGNNTIRPELITNAEMRKESELTALSYLMDPRRLKEVAGGKVVELAAGTSDVGIVLKYRDADLSVTTIELKPHSAVVGAGYARSLGLGIRVRNANLNEIDIPGGVWVAKHPCGELSDQIIEKWIRQKDSPMLFLMTCCHGGAQKKPRYGVDKKTWRQLCKRSDWTSCNDPKKRRIGQESMDMLDRLRINYIRGANRDYKAQLYHAEQILEALGSYSVPVYKGNIIVAEKMV
jgi:hypothetical protein